MFLRIRSFESSRIEIWHNRKTVKQFRVYLYGAKFIYMEERDQPPSISNSIFDRIGIDLVLGLPVTVRWIFTCNHRISAVMQSDQGPQ